MKPTFYYTVENDKMISGPCDAFYGHREYQKLRGQGISTGSNKAFHEAEKLFKRLQYVIPKDEKGNLTEVTLLEAGRIISVHEEMEKGMDRLTIGHLWRGDPYRFNHVIVEPLGYVQWVAPDVFYWDKGHHLNEK